MNYGGKKKKPLHHCVRLYIRLVTFVSDSCITTSPPTNKFTFVPGNVARIILYEPYLRGCSPSACNLWFTDRNDYGSSTTTFMLRVVLWSCESNACHHPRNSRHLPQQPAARTPKWRPGPVLATPKVSSRSSGFLSRQCVGEPPRSPSHDIYFPASKGNQRSYYLRHSPFILGY